MAAAWPALCVPRIGILPLGGTIAGFGGDQMRDLGFAVAMEATDRFLQRAIGVGNARVLAQMFEPRFEVESLDEVARLGGVFEHVPGIGAIAAALQAEPVDGGKKRIAVRVR